MVYVKKEGVILESTGLDFENQAVLNPTCIIRDGELHMFYRAVRQGNHSSIGYCRLDGPLNVVERSEKPIMYPEHDYERHGLEDPRIVEVDGVYHLFYTAYDGKNALAAYATSKDLKNFEKKGVITPKMSYDEAEDLFRQSKLKDKYFFFESYYKDVVAPDVLLWEKDAFLFPKKIGGKFALIHRILPDIQVAYFNDFTELTRQYWKTYLAHLSDYILLSSKYWFESRNIGGGCAPIETEKGWLLIYHAVEDSDTGKIYHASAALLDKENPQKVLGHLQNPLFSPQEEWERHGDVDNVVFPTGAAVFDDRLYIYYGAADKRIACVSLDLNELLDELVHSNDYPRVFSEVGFTAGQVFQSSLKKPSTYHELMKDLGKDGRLILMAIGWLAREGKLEFIDVKDELKIKSKNNGRK